MTSEVIQLIGRLRIAVGFLGEKPQRGWWTSEFLGANSRAFLAPVFPRTHALAQLHGVTTAAAVVHDERIGVGGVFHLFRLPEDMEEDLHALGNESIAQATEEVTGDEGSALGLLESLASDQRDAAVGPVRVGQVSALRSESAWHDVATCYLAAFEGEREIFPFFSDLN